MRFVKIGDTYVNPEQVVTVKHGLQGTEVRSATGLVALTDESVEAVVCLLTTGDRAAQEWGCRDRVQTAYDF